MRKIITLPILIAAAVLTTSCSDKLERLNTEQAKLENQKLAVQTQIQQYEANLKTVGGQAAATVTPLQRQATEMQRKAVEVEAQANDKLQVWTDLEAKAAAVRQKVDSWKAKYLR
jgi:chromosome segregation ATPase